MLYSPHQQQRPRRSSQHPISHNCTTRTIFDVNMLRLFGSISRFLPERYMRTIIYEDVDLNARYLTNQTDVWQFEYIFEWLLVFWHRRGKQKKIIRATELYNWHWTVVLFFFNINNNISMLDYLSKRAKIIKSHLSRHMRCASQHKTGIIRIVAKEKCMWFKIVIDTVPNSVIYYLIDMIW